MIAEKIPTVLPPREGALLKARFRRALDLASMSEGRGQGGGTSVPFPAGPLAWDGLLTFWVRNLAIGVWILVMGWVLGQAIARQRADDEAPAK